MVSEAKLRAEAQTQAIEAAVRARDQQHGVSVRALEEVCSILQRERSQEKALGVWWVVGWRRWWLILGGWCQVAGGQWLVAGGWRLVG